MIGSRLFLKHRSTTVVLVGALLAVGMAGCGTTSTTVASTHSGIRAPDVTWMISAGALERLAAGGLPRPLLQTYFDQPSTIVLGATGSTPDPLAPKATPAADFTSATALVTALQQKKIPARVKYLVLDLEAWPLTPIDEQRDPMAAARQALAAAHGAGKEVIFTPALDLLHVLEPGKPQSPTAQLRIFERAVVVPGAKASDVLEIQSQQTEGTPLATVFAPSAIAAACSARPGERVLAGLSTNPDGRRVTPADVYQLYTAARAAGASGFWLNIPETGVACPRCGTAQPEVAVQFLEQLARAQGSPSSTTAAAPSARTAVPTGSLPPPSSTPIAPGPLTNRAGQLLGAGGKPADWILAASQFAAVVSTTQVRALLGGGTVYEPVSSRQEPSSLLPVVPTLALHSEALLSQMLASKSVPPGVRAVLYDNERFPATPSVEQAAPGTYDADVAMAARAQGWTSICDLVEPDRLPPTQRAAADEVPPCTVVGLNTVQQSERDPATYAALVSHDVALVHSVAPERAVLAGLSSNPAGPPVSAAELAADIAATHDLVAGYWLNVPAPGSGCPACHEPDPALMTEALQDVAR